MGNRSTRRKHTSKFKAIVAIDAIRERKTLTERSVDYQVSPLMISKWKRMGLDGMPAWFENKATRSKADKTETGTDEGFQNETRWDPNGFKLNFPSF
ncbi:MAG: hypothetical protein OXC61_11595 [Flavobacteriaceae bacterium]|nr:hypothetical protein [Flavobacteriaceae bacterium]